MSYGLDREWVLKSDEKRIKYSDMMKKDVQSWRTAHSDCFQYLISKSYATPLFFAPNHWANGKTAIELGIAIDKTLQ